MILRKKKWRVYVVDSLNSRELLLDGIIERSLEDHSLSLLVAVICKTSASLCDQHRDHFCTHSLLFRFVSSSPVPSPLPIDTSLLLPFLLSQGFSATSLSLSFMPLSCCYHHDSPTESLRSDGVFPSPSPAPPPSPSLLISISPLTGQYIVKIFPSLNPSLRPLRRALEVCLNGNMRNLMSVLADIQLEVSQEEIIGNIQKKGFEISFLLTH
jgi:hypothetical protein